MRSCVLRKEGCLALEWGWDKEDWYSRGTLFKAYLSTLPKPLLLQKFLGLLFPISHQRLPAEVPCRGFLRQTLLPHPHRKGSIWFNVLQLPLKLLKLLRREGGQKFILIDGFIFTKSPSVAKCRHGPNLVRHPKSLKKQAFKASRGWREGKWQAGRQLAWGMASGAF